MATTNEEIVNQALSILGARAISSLSGNEPNAIKANIHFDAVRDAVLRAHPWNFATKWSSALTATGNDPPIDKWAYEFAKPGSTLRILRMENDQSQWEILGQYIYCNVEEPKFKSIYQITDPTMWDVLFDQAFVFRLASVLAIPITGKLNKFKTLLVLIK